MKDYFNIYCHWAYKQAEMDELIKKVTVKDERITEVRDNLHLEMKLELNGVERKYDISIDSSYPDGKKELLLAKDDAVYQFAQEALTIAEAKVIDDTGFKSKNKTINAYHLFRFKKAAKEMFSDLIDAALGENVPEKQFDMNADLLGEWFADNFKVKDEKKRIAFLKKEMQVLVDILSNSISYFLK